MNNKEKYGILIPIYKYNLDECDKLSLSSLQKSLLKTNNRVNIEIISPSRFATNIIFEETQKYVDTLFGGHNQVSYNYFDDDFFERKMSYSNLLLQQHFYKHFENYEHIVIYQLDCYMFEDVLDEYIEKDYDYIGSVIFATNSDWSETTPYIGNGGFSVRKISTFINILDRNSRLWQLHKDEFENKHLPKNSDFKYIDFEDIFICNMIGKYYPLNLPYFKDILTFYWDRNCEYIYDTYGIEKPSIAHNYTLFCNYYSKYIPEITSNKYIRDFCDKRVEDWLNMYHPEEQGYGN